MNELDNLKSGFNISRNTGFLAIGMAAFTVALADSSEKITAIQSVAPLVLGLIGVSVLGMVASKIAIYFCEKNNKKEHKLKFN